MIYPIKSYLRKRSFERMLPNLINMRMKEREEKTKLVNKKLAEKLMQILVVDEVQNDPEEDMSNNFKKQFYLEM